MSWTEMISIALNFLFTGGGLMLLINFRSVRKKAKEDAKEKELENEKKAAEIVMDFIVEPLKKEINALRKDVRRLQKAIDEINHCPHLSNCPVRHSLQDNQDGESQE